MCRIRTITETFLDDHIQEDYSRKVHMDDQSGNTNTCTLQYMSSFIENMLLINPTHRAINEVRDIVRAWSPGIDGAAIEQKARLEAEKLKNIIVDLQNLSNIAGV